MIQGHSEAVAKSAISSAEFGSGCALLAMGVFQGLASLKGRQARVVTGAAGAGAVLGVGAVLGAGTALGAGAVLVADAGAALDGGTAFVAGTGLGVGAVLGAGAAPGAVGAVAGTAVGVAVVLGAGAALGVAVLLGAGAALGVAVLSVDAPSDALPTGGATLPAPVLSAAAPSPAVGPAVGASVAVTTMVALLAAALSPETGVLRRFERRLACTDDPGFDAEFALSEIEPTSPLQAASIKGATPTSAATIENRFSCILTSVQRLTTDQRWSINNRTLRDQCTQRNGLLFQLRSAIDGRDCGQTARSPGKSTRTEALQSVLTATRPAPCTAVQRNVHRAIV